MSPIQIALLLLAVAGVWAVVELALTLRKTRTVVDSLDKTVSDLNNTLAEHNPWWQSSMALSMSSPRAGTG